MKTLTLRNIPEEVKEIIKNEGFFYYPATKRAYKVIRIIPKFRKTIAELDALTDDSKTTGSNAIPDVSQQRELLNRFLNWEDGLNGKENIQSENYKYIDEFLKTIK